MVLEDPTPVELAPDPDDDPLLAATLTGRADYLVTGDGGLLGLERLGHARILEPRTFLEDVLGLTR